MNLTDTELKNEQKSLLNLEIFFSIQKKFVYGHYSGYGNMCNWFGKKKWRKRYWMPMSKHKSHVTFSIEI